MHTLTQLLGVFWLNDHTVPRVEAEFLTTQGLTTRQPAGREGATQPVLVGVEEVVVVVEVTVLDVLEGIVVLLGLELVEDVLVNEDDAPAGPPHSAPREHSGTTMTIV
jgi:hypothetical protein